MFRKRLVSSLVLGPPVLLAAYVGFPYFEIMLAVFGATMAWEWEHMLHRAFTKTGMMIGAAAVLLVVLAWHDTLLAVAVLVVCTALLLIRANHKGGQYWRLLGIGIAIIGAPMVALTHLDRVGGAAMLFWVFGVVWATDVGAYAWGRLIGGPKLAPRVSPSKTWAGLLGGIVSAALVGYGVGAVLALDAPWVLALLSGPLAIVGQAGDLLQSMVKRHVGVKDSGWIIPGHGGILDRVDGLMAVAPVVAVLSVALGGVLAGWPGQGGAP